METMVLEQGVIALSFKTKKHSKSVMITKKEGKLKMQFFKTEGDKMSPFEIFIFWREIAKFGSGEDKNLKKWWEKECDKQIAYTLSFSENKKKEEEFA